MPNAKRSINTIDTPKQIQVTVKSIFPFFYADKQLFIFLDLISFSQHKQQLTPQTP